MSILDFSRPPIDIEAVKGPPGTGKTYQLLERMKREVSAGTSLAQIGVVTFTRAATSEMRSRAASTFRASDAGMQYIATIHSTSFQLLKRDGMDASGRLLDNTWLQAFAKEHGYHLSRMEDPDVQDAPPDALVQTDDDRLHYVFG